MEDFRLTDREVKAYLFVFLSVLLLTLWQTTLDNELVPMNYYYADVVEQTNRLRMENELLHEKILNQESLITLYGEAMQLGFTPAQYVYLK